ncbi:MAG: putative metal-binding motif-containing protein [Sandaracinaceae bacterium]|nr:putative metal-binding motif-containing protein [Sandaracinaceae bacterium]
MAGHSLAATDCDDASAQEHPAQLDICDLSDNNCNTTVDELPICDVVQFVGAAGGTLTATATGGGTIRVEIPAGALGSSSPTPSVNFTRARCPTWVRSSFVGRPVVISPVEQVFTIPANVTLPAAGQNLVVLRLDDEDDTTWEVVEATFTGGQALFGADSGGIYVVVTKTCTASTETCDSVDNDCDWLVDEEGVCSSSETLAERIVGWWNYCDEFEVQAPTTQLIQSACANAEESFMWFAADGTSGGFSNSECRGFGPWSTPTESTVSLHECEGTANAQIETYSLVYFDGADEEYLILVWGSGSETEYEVLRRIASPPSSCAGTPYVPDLFECGPVIGAPCATDWHVVGNACVLCPSNSTNEAGDDPTGANTACGCRQDSHVIDGECVFCDVDSMNPAGDDPAGGDTVCEEVVCGDDTCHWSEDGACEEDCRGTCGDQTCSWWEVWDAPCMEDCCGNGQCIGSENSTSCPSDCE